MVGRDSDLSLWYSNWLKKGPLRSLVQGPLSREASSMKVKEFLLDTGWNWDATSYELPEDIRLMIRATPLAFTSRGRDKLVWNGTSQGVFDLKSAYKLSMSSEESQPYSASWVWKVDTLPRIKYFLWMCGHNSIGVKSGLVKRGVLEDDCCPICHEESETILHVLWDCPQTRLVWAQLGIQEANQRFWGSDLQDWLNWNGRQSGKSIMGNLPWCTTFPFATWNIWKRRNSIVFRNNSCNPNLSSEIVN